MTARLSAVCHLTYAFEVGLAIDLDRCDRVLAATSRQTVGSSRRVPRYFDYRPPPLRVDAGPGAAIAGLVASKVEIVLLDFGAAAVAYQLPFEGAAEALATLSESLQANVAFEQDARRRIDALLPTLGDAVSRPKRGPISEDYLVIAIDPATLPGDSTSWLRDHTREFAAMLRGGAGRLAPEELDDAVAEHLSFARTDLTIIDWNAAIIVDPEPDDTRLLLEFANLQLLELRHLDGELDRALERGYDMVARTERRWRHPLRPPASALRHIGELQMDAAALFERVSSAVKLVGDQFFGRVYLAVSRRFHFEAWDRAISRKLDVLDGIYQKVGDRITARRLEVLEWIVIILIAAELILGFAK
ncbi:MAG: hypothetical protein SFV24_22990 [Gemmatimonadales bacterium]|nr:hypothetical protein [Gemmatimonadales bacterium]